MKKLLFILLLMSMVFGMSSQQTKGGVESENWKNNSQKTSTLPTQCLTTVSSDKQLEQWMEEAAKEYNVNPNFLKAVAYIESRRGKEKYRCGWIGKPAKRKGRTIYPGTYCGPMAIHYYYISAHGVDISDPKLNIWAGAKALCGVGSDPVAQKRRLKGDGKRSGYNASFTESYWKAIKQAERKFAAGLL